MKKRNIPRDGMVTCGISFNFYDPDQKELLDHADKRTNFSAYVKRLIQRDRDGIVVSGHFQPGLGISEPSPVIDRSLMRNLI